MAAKESASNRHVTLLPDGIEKVTLINLIKEFMFSPSISQSNLLQHNIPKDEESKYLHRNMIFLSLLILRVLKFLANPLKNFGSAIEDFLNGILFLRKEERSMYENSDGFISFIGQIDTRMELNKDIKHGDARYYPALSMMASKLAYENEILIKTTISQRWKMNFVEFHNCYNEVQKQPTTQAFIMREETAEDDKIIVAFRGTSPFDADDWSTDFNFSWCEIDGIGKIHMGFVVALGLKKYYHKDEDYSGEFLKQITQDPERPLAYYAIRDKLKEIMASNTRAKFIVTGHSLGGALAVLFPAVLALHGEVELLNKLEAIYTYGQPRVGNKYFGQFMKSKLREHNIKYYRIVYGHDIVSKLPWDNTMMTFKHFGTSIHFNSLYHGKIVEEQQQKSPKKEVRLKKYSRMLSGTVMKLMKYILAVLCAMWELMRGFIIGFTAGPYYREGWLLIGLRTLGILCPCAVNHNPQDYVNATMLASEDLFKYYPALNT